LGRAYAALLKWMDNNGYEPADNPRESYIDGIWNKETPEEWLTEVQFPMKKKEV
jgi:effector-binding domain-containing protein